MITFNKQLSTLNHSTSQHPCDRTNKGHKILAHFTEEKQKIKLIENNHSKFEIRRKTKRFVYVPKRADAASIRSDVSERTAKILATTRAATKRPKLKDLRI